MKRNTAILVGIALICGVGVTIVEMGPQRVRQQQQLEAEQLLTVAPEDVTAVDIQQGDNGEAISLTKETTGWQLIQPVETPAEDLVVQSLLTTLTASDAPAVVSEDSADGEQLPDLDSFGLATPEQTIVLTHGDAASTIRVGGSTFDSSGQYLQVNDGPVRILDISLVSQLSLDLFALRDKTLVDWTPESLQAFTISTPDETVELEKSDDTWQLADRPDALLNDQDIADTLSQAQYLQASQFIAETKDDLAAYGLDSPEVEIEATLADGNRQTISIGGPVEGDPSARYATSSERNTVVALSTSNLEAIATSEVQLRDRSLGQFSAALIGEIDISADDPDLNFTLSPSTSPEAGPDEWEIADQPDRVVSIESFLIPLSDARADGFLPADDPDASALLDAPAISMQVTPTDGVANEPLMLEFAAGDEELYVKTSHIPGEILVFDRQFYDLLEAAIGTFKPAA